MSITELILLIFGGLVFTISFFLPSGRKKETDNIPEIDEEEIKEIIDKEIEEAKVQIRDIVDETINYSMEKTERSIERITNEKIMAVNEFSGTVLEQINKNHKETIFLYDMLNDKHENLKTAVSEAAKTAAEVKQSVREAEFLPFKPEKVEIRGAAEEKEEKAEKPRKKTSRKAKGEEAVKLQEPEKEKIPAKENETAEKGQKAVNVDVSLDAAEKTGSGNNNEKILELHKAGKSNMAIAKELGLGIGEVKLVIDLFEGI